MSAELAKFEMVALGKVEVGGVEYAPGDVFVVHGADRVRWLIANRAAKPHSLAEVEAGVASAPQGTTTTPTAAPTGDNSGTRDGKREASGQTGTVKPRRRG